MITINYQRYYRSMFIVIRCMNKFYLNVRQVIVASFLITISNTWQSYNVPTRGRARTHAYIQLTYKLFETLIPIILCHCDVSNNTSLSSHLQRYKYVLCALVAWWCIIDCMVLIHADVWTIYMERVLLL